MPVESLVWLIVLVLCLLAEGLTQGIVAVWFAIGALVSLLTASLRTPVYFQFTVFLLTSGALLLATRPLVRAYFQTRQTYTNADRIVGMTCRVTAPIDNIAGTGAIRVDGKDWTARAENRLRFMPGDVVRVVRIGGATAFVEGLTPEELFEATGQVPDPDSPQGAVFERSGAKAAGPGRPAGA